MAPPSYAPRLPAEWEPQSAVWFSWPVPGAHWSHEQAGEIEAAWAQLTALISQSQTVRINSAAHHHARIWSALNTQKAYTPHVELYPHANNDVWCRDHGALFLKNGQETVATDWAFNGWGGNFTPYELDNALPPQMASSQNMTCLSYREVLEGGAIESNGEGTLLTTEAVLLNPNRNPHLTSRCAVEQMLHERLGIKRTIWLGEGILGDDTGGHIDDIARFITPNTILMATDTNGPNQHTLAENWNRIAETHCDLSLIPLPMPKACEVPGWRLPTLPASYANFLITNHLVLVPTFRQPQNDDHALGILREVFPSREVLGIDALRIVEEGGAIHCISMQEPR